jgi:hypothetical protein
MTLSDSRAMSVSIAFTGPVSAARYYLCLSADMCMYLCSGIAGCFHRTKLVVAATARKYTGDNYAEPAAGGILRSCSVWFGTGIEFQTVQPPASALSGASK